MVQTNGNATGAKSVLAEIEERLAALTPKQLTEPKLKPDKGFHATGEANDYIKRLSALRNQACDEHNVIAGKIEASFVEVRKGFKSADSLRSLADTMQAMAKIQEDETLTRLRIEASQKRSFHRIVDTIFWLEIRRQYPELSDKPCISIRNNWLVGWSDVEDEDEDPLGLGGGHGIPQDLAAFLRSQMRR